MPKYRNVELTMTYKTQHSEKGFTLIEVLIATAILSIGLLVVANMTAKSTIQDSRAYYMSRASMLMEEYLENATRIQYNATAFNNFTNSTNTKTIDGVNYTMSCTVTRNTPISTLNTAQTNCTISWNNKGFNSSTRYVYVFSKKF